MHVYLGACIDVPCPYPANLRTTTNFFLGNAVAKAKNEFLPRLVSDSSVSSYLGQPACRFPCHLQVPRTARPSFRKEGADLPDDRPQYLHFLVDS